MKYIYTYFLCTLLIAAIAITSCKKKGDPGPQGIQGETGATGAKGETGAAGPQGVDGKNGTNGTNGTNGEKGDKGDKGDAGTAGANGAAGAAGKDGSNNVSTYLLTNQSVSLTGYTRLSIPAITADIVNNGYVLVYFQINGDNSWYALPYSEVDRQLTVANYGTGFVNIKSNFTAGGLNFKVVVVTGTTAVKLQTVYPGLNLLNAANAARYLNLN